MTGDIDVECDVRGSRIMIIGTVRGARVLGIVVMMLWYQSLKPN